MFFAVLKVRFEEESSSYIESRDLGVLCEKVRSRFKVSAAVSHTPNQDGYSAIAIAHLAKSEAHLSKKLDAIVEYCESAGLGRVAEDAALIDHIDNLDDYTEESN